MYSSAITALALLSGLLQAASLAPHSLTTSVSPDGYRYVVEEQPYIPRLITHPDGTTSTVLVHPQLAATLVNQGTSPNLVTRLISKGAGRDWDTCGASSFNGKTSGGSPLVSDCAKIRDFYRDTRNGGYYAADWALDLKLNGDWARLVITDSCVFGIKSGGTTCSIHVGNTDMSDVTQDAINRFQADGRVGAEGEMDCDIVCREPYGRSPVEWALFHS